MWVPGQNGVSSTSQSQNLQPTHATAYRSCPQHQHLSAHLPSKKQPIYLHSRHEPSPICKPGKAPCSYSTYVYQSPRTACSVTQTQGLRHYHTRLYYPIPIPYLYLTPPITSLLYFPSPSPFPLPSSCSHTIQTRINILSRSPRHLLSSNYKDML